MLAPYEPGGSPRGQPATGGQNGWRAAAARPIDEPPGSYTGSGFAAPPTASPPDSPRGPITKALPPAPTSKAVPDDRSSFYTPQISPRGPSSQYGNGSPGPNGWLRSDQKIPPTSQANTRAASPLPTSMSNSPSASPVGSILRDTVEAKYESPKHEGQLMEKEDGRWKMYYFELRDGMLYKFQSTSSGQSVASASAMISRVRVYEQDVVESSASDFEFELRLEAPRVFRAFTETEYLRWLVALRGAAQFNQVRENVRNTLKLAPAAANQFKVQEVMNVKLDDGNDRKPPPGTADLTASLAAGKSLKLEKSTWITKLGGKLLPRWQRRWSVLRDGVLNMYKTIDTNGKCTTTFDLHFCSPRVLEQTQKRRYCFSIITPRKSYVLSAENSEEMMDWISTLQRAQAHAMNTLLAYSLDVASAVQDPQFRANKRLQELVKIPGIFVCITCSGVHRKIGVHVSQVRSVTLDRWTEDAVRVMENMGNVRANQIWEARVTPPHKKIDADVSHVERERYIRAKYEARLFRADANVPV